MSGGILKRKSTKRLINLMEESFTNLDKTEDKIPRKNLAIFLSKKEEIKEAMDAGWNMKAIWQVLKDQGIFNGSYDSFIRYIRKHLRPSSVKTVTAVIRPAPVAPVHHLSPVPANPPGGNKFNFSANFDEDELYGGETPQASTPSDISTHDK